MLGKFLCFDTDMLDLLKIEGMFVVISIFSSIFIKLFKGNDYKKYKKYNTY